MSSERTIEQELEFADLAYVTKAESTGNIKNAEHMTINFSEQFLKNLKALDNFLRNVKSRYECPLNMLKSFKEDLDQYFYEIINMKNPKLDDVIILALSYATLGCMKRNMDWSPENLEMTEYYYTRSMTLLKDKELDSKVILIAMSNLMELHGIYMHLKNAKKDLQCLNKAMMLYLEYTKGEDEFPVPIDVRAAVGISFETNTVYQLDRLYMDVLSILIRSSGSFEHRMIDMEKVAQYMHKLLKKLLNTVPFSVTYTAWTIDAIQLAEYFLSCERLIECKNHLCVASVMVKRYYDELYMKVNLETSTKEKDRLYNRFKIINFIVNLIWVKYGLVILHLSKKQLLLKEEKDNCYEENKSMSEFTTQSNEKFTELLIFTDKEFLEFTIIYPDNYITNHSDAKMLFVHILKLLGKLKIDKFALASIEFRIEIAQFTSRAYKYFASYEHDKINQMKLQKRRIDVLEDCLKTFDVRNNLESSLFMWLELGVIYSTLLDMKIENLYEDKLTVEKLAQINLLLKNGVYYFQLYLDNFEKKNIQVCKNSQNINIISHFNLRYKRTSNYVCIVDANNDIKI